MSSKFHLRTASEYRSTYTQYIKYKNYRLYISISSIFLTVSVPDHRLFVCVQMLAPWYSCHERIENIRRLVPILSFSVKIYRNSCVPLFQCSVQLPFLALTTTPYNHVKRCSILSKRLAELVIILLVHHSHMERWVLYMGMYTCMSRVCAPIFKRVLPCPNILKPVQMPDVHLCNCSV